MSTMKNKKYRIDGEPASADDILRMAENYSEKFANDWLKMTSVAAGILRENGHVVDHNPEYTEAQP